MSVGKRYKDKTKTKFSSWEFRAYYPTGKYDRFGKPEVKLKTKAGFKTMKEALDAEREFLNSIDNNNIELNKEITCGWVMDNYIKHLEDEGKAKGTIENYKSLKKYHLSFFVDIKVCNINQDHIDYWENELRTKKKQRGGGKISNYTKYDCVKFLKAAFRYGVKKKKIKVNPFKDIEVTCPSSLPRNRLSTTEVKETIKLCKKELPSYYGLYCIAIMTVMRVGEYSALKVEDIDFRNKTIKVNKQNTRNEYKDILKTSSSYRFVHLVEELEKAILWHMEKFDIRTGLLFKDSTGKPVSSKHVSRKFQKLLKLYGKPENFMRVHDLRGEYIDIMHAAGNPTEITSREVGHSKTSTTSDIYTNLLDEHTKEAMKKFNAMFVD